MKNKVRFYVLAAKDEENNLIKDFDMHSFLLSFNKRIDEDVDGVRKEIDKRALRCLPVKVVSKDLKQLVVPIGRMKSEDLYRENPDKKDMSMVDERLYDMNAIFYSGIHNRFCIRPSAGRIQAHVKTAAAKAFQAQSHKRNEKDLFHKKAL